MIVALVLDAFGSTNTIFAADGNQAKDILQKAGMTGGLACVIGADKPELAIGLAQTGRFLVQALDTDAAKVSAA